MHVVIIGGGGFVGGRLAKSLAEKGSLGSRSLEKISLVDWSFPKELPHYANVDRIEGDFSEPAVINPVLAEKPDLIFHLAAVVSGQAEKDFDLGMKVNLQGSLNVLETCRSLDYKPRLIFASSCGVFGGDVTAIVRDDTAPKPRSSYGTQKAVVELLVNDYSRRGFVDGRTLRLPTIVVRPGKPNAATSSFLSSIIREPLNGKSTSYPVSEGSEFWLLSPKRLIENLLHAAVLDEKELGDDRVITLPGITASVGELLASLRSIAGDQVAAKAHYEPDVFLQSIVLTWPAHFNPQRALDLGFVYDQDTKELINNYIQEENISLS